MNDQNNPQSNEQDQIPPETRAFLESLLEEVHMEAVDDTQKEEMLVQLYARLDYFLTAKIIDAIPEADLDAFTQMNEQGKSREEVEAFIMEKVPQAQDLFKDAFLEFHDLYVGAGREMIADEQQQEVSAPADTIQPVTAPIEEVQPASPVMSEPAAMSTQDMNMSMPEDVPPPPPAPVPFTPSEDEHNGSGSMSN